MPPIPPLTKNLMLACTAVFCLQLILPLERWLALWPLHSGLFMPWQVLSYAFLHGGFGHLFFNMLGLWMFGSELERLWGAKRYIQLLLASILAAAVVQLVFTLLTGSLNPTLGASGGLFGLLLAYGMLFPNQRVMLLFPPIPMPAWLFVTLYGALELYLGVTGSGQGVAHFAHLGGMAAGYVLLVHWARQRGTRR